MSKTIEMAKNRLYGDEGLKVADIKPFPGHSNDVTLDQRVEQVNRVIAQLETGEFDVVAEYEE